MIRKLSYGPDFKPLVYNADKEPEFYPNGLFLFYITNLSEYIASHPEEFSMVDIGVIGYFNNQVLIGSKELYEEYIEAADLSRLVIVLEIAPDRYEMGICKREDDLYHRGFNLVDGHHRIMKANGLGIKTIKAYVVRMEQHLPFMVKGYKEYVDYWNEKVIGNLDFSKMVS